MSARADLLALLLVSGLELPLIAGVFAAFEEPPRRGTSAILPPWPALVATIAASIAAALVGLQGGARLVTKAVLAVPYLCALVSLGTSTARLARRAGVRPPAAAVTAALLLAAFDGALVFVGPALSLVSDAPSYLPVLLLLSPMTALAGSLLEIDLLRAAPLYSALPFATESPFAYPPFPEALGMLVLLAIAAAIAAAAPRPIAIRETPSARDASIRAELQ